MRAGARWRSASSWRGRPPFPGVVGRHPPSLGVDEPQIMIRSLTMVRSGDFHPHFFDYPSLYLYLQAGVVVAKFLAGASAGAWSSLAGGRPRLLPLGSGPDGRLRHRHRNRFTPRAGRRWGTAHALLAAGLLAVLPMHVRESHYVLTDVPTTFFVALAFVLSLRAHERGTGSAFAWAGAAAGLATGTSTKRPGWRFCCHRWRPPWRPARLTSASGVRSQPRRPLSPRSWWWHPTTVLDSPGFLDGFGAPAAGCPSARGGAEAGWVVI